MKERMEPRLVTPTTNRPHAALHPTEFDPDYPEPVGWRILVKIKDMPEKSRGGIFFPDTVKDAQRALGVTGLLIAVGPRAYTREDMGGYPWCKPGDWVLIGKYAGVRMLCKGHEIRMMNDDEVLGLVPAPEEISNV